MHHKSPERFPELRKIAGRHLRAVLLISVCPATLTGDDKCHSSHFLGAAAFVGRPSKVTTGTSKRLWMTSDEHLFGPVPSPGHGLDPLLEIMQSQGTIPVNTQRVILDHLLASGLENTNMALLLAQDFIDRPEVLASVLMTDFGFTPLLAHQTRTVLSEALRKRNANVMSSNSTSNRKIDRIVSQPDSGSSSKNMSNRKIDGVSPPQDNTWRIGSALPRAAAEEDWNISEANVGSFSDPGPIDQSTFTARQEKLQPSTTTQSAKKPLVNVKQSERRNKAGSQYEYGLPRDYKALYPTLASELNDFYRFMTEPSTSSQGEDPIRPATAKVYLRHANLFLGWHLLATNKNIVATTHEGQGDDASDPSSLSIYRVIQSKQKESAGMVIDFVMWLRREREVSASYEANILRGITKLLKFRFRNESEEGNSAVTFVDIPMIQEIRKLHRTAEQKNRNGPSSSDEQKKWLPWPEYLQVIEKTKDEVGHLRRTFEQLDPSEYRYRRQDTCSISGGNIDDCCFCLQGQEVALAFQRYLILAIFACIPDRQRTIRELELGRTLIREVSLDCWVVRHGPDDYKTGQVYGERAPMQLASELTTALDEFIDKWRPMLRPTTNFLFVQAQTGQALTGDSVYQRVSQSCYKYTGKRTNPHLLRSMIITHVREVSNASEKDLEALALFMGHSIQMQRSSYDKRTLDQKIAPAVQLLQTINRGENNASGSAGL